MLDEKDRCGGGGLVSSAAPLVQLLPEEKSAAVTTEGKRMWVETDKRRRLGFDYVSPKWYHFNDAKLSIRWTSSFLISEFSLSSMTSEVQTRVGASKFHLNPIPNPV